MCPPWKLSRHKIPHKRYADLKTVIDDPDTFSSAAALPMIYDNPPGGHTFDRRVDPSTWQPENTREQRDSWNRVWTFLDWNLDPFRGALQVTTK